MCADLITPNGRPIRLGKELGRGGEGVVHAVADEPGRVAKIYIHPLDIAKAEKLAAMANGCTEKLSRIAAWPTETVLDARRGRVRGFLMRNVARDKDIHVVCGPKTRLTHYPKATYRFLVRVATNLARAFAVVHDHGHVVGDVNQGGVCVSPEGTISLVDCDSYQVKAGSRIYPCDVGIPLYQPPEFQTVTTFRALPRETNHDGFGLAVLIFQTLFFARHPFSGRFLGRGEMPLEQAIREYRFAYARDAKRRWMVQPPHTLGLNAVPPALALLFERAFLEEGARGLRPTAREWIDSLVAFDAELTDCKQNSGHSHRKGIPDCPLCEIEHRAHTMLFLPVGHAPPARPLVDLAELWRELSPMLEELHLARVSAPAQFANPRALPASIVEYKQRRETVRAVGLIAIICLLLAAYLWTPWMLLFVGVVVLGVRTITSAEPAELALLAEELDSSRQAIASLTREIERERAGNPVFSLAEQVRVTYAAARDVEQKRIELLRRFEQDRHARQLSQHLDRFEVEKCGIKGVGPSLLATLVSHGIETAADISESRLRLVPGFGPKRIMALVSWRRRLESSFRPSVDPGNSDVVERYRLERELGNQHDRCLRELVRLSGFLKAQVPPFSRKMRALHANLYKAHEDFATARAGRQLVGRAA